MNQCEWGVAETVSAIVACAAVVVLMLMAGIGVVGRAHAGDVISPRYTGPRLGNLQCLVRNDTTRALYVIPEWIECTNLGTVSTHGGKEMVPGENLNLVTTDRRACRCRVTFDGKPGDVSIMLASGSDGAPAPRH